MITSLEESHPRMATALTYVRAVYDGIQTGMALAEVAEAYEEFQAAGGAGALTVILIAGLPLGF